MKRISNRMLTSSGEMQLRHPVSVHLEAACVAAVREKYINQLQMAEFA